MAEDCRPLSRGGIHGGGVLDSATGPQRSDTLLANEIVSRLDATLAELKQEAAGDGRGGRAPRRRIERIRRSAERRVDASSWEAVDALATRLRPVSPRRRTPLKWAEESLARYDAAFQANGAGDVAAAQAAELTKALERLQQHGLLRGAPEAVQQLMKGGRLPTDAASLRALMSSLSKQLAEAKGRSPGSHSSAEVAGRFDPAEFPVAPLGVGGWQSGTPGRGGANAGRADADLTWGKETAPLEKVQGQATSAGAPRGPDDWTPVAELPGAPDAAPVLTSPSAARQYAAVAGQSAWRRTLAPRHQSAVKKYLEK